MFTPPNMSHVMCHVSRVTCHVSHVTCHVSPVTCHMSTKKNWTFFLFIYLYFFFLCKKKIGKSGGASRWRVCYQRGLPRLVFLQIPVDGFGEKFVYFNTPFLTLLNGQYIWSMLVLNYKATFNSVKYAQYFFLCWKVFWVKKRVLIVFLLFYVNAWKLPNIFYSEHK